MTTSTAPSGIETELRLRADAAARDTYAAPSLARNALREANRHRQRVRWTGALIVTGGVLASVAAVSVGGGPYVEYRQPSEVMAPTVRAGESVALNRDLQPQRGDVVLVTLPVPGTDVEALSRIIGLPGDTVSCPTSTPGVCAGVEVNGTLIADAYLSNLQTAPFDAMRVSAGAVFVLGDARDVAVDSRTLGPIKADKVNGVAVAVLSGTEARHLPGAPIHTIPEDYRLDPEQPVPPASTQ